MVENGGDRVLGFNIGGGYFFLVRACFMRRVQVWIPATRKKEKDICYLLNSKISIRHVK